MPATRSLTITPAEVGALTLFSTFDRHCYFLNF